MKNRYPSRHFKKVVLLLLMQIQNLALLYLVSENDIFRVGLGPDYFHVNTPLVTQNVAVNTL